MKSISLLLSLLVAASSFAAEDSFKFKGYEKINQTTFEKIYYGSDEFSELGLIIGERFFDGGFFGPTTILTLLGYYTDGHNGSEMVNGDPNAMNTMLYFILFDRMAQSMADHCAVIDDPVVDLGYQLEFYSLLRNWCAQDISQPIYEYALQQTWLQVMGYEAPESEYHAWREHMLTRQFASQEERVYYLFVTLLMNPYFFIEN